MRVIVIGGTGFIGRHFVRRIMDTGLDIIVLSRNPSKVMQIFEEHVMGFEWDACTGAGWDHLITSKTYIVNLAGENIAAGRWTAAVRQKILESRVNAGKAIVDAVRRAQEKPVYLIQSSAVSYYGFLGLNPVDESASRGSTGFLSAVARDWENSTYEVQKMGVPRAIIRTGIVLGDGGILAKMLPWFRLGLGVRLGGGRQGMSWIHIADHVGAMLHLMQKKLSGVFNLSAPYPVSNWDFAQALGHACGRPVFLSAPSSMLRLALGQMADEVLLTGQYVLPKHLEKAGYKFRYPSLEQALAQIVA